VSGRHRAGGAHRQQRHTYYVHPAAPVAASTPDDPVPSVPRAPRHPAAADLPEVDVAIVMESTYPYLTGGVAAVVHDIVRGNRDLMFGIIHITWDRHSPHEDLYGVPENVRWVHPMYLSMQEHGEDFTSLRPRDLGMRAPARAALARRVFDALTALIEHGDVEPLWQLYDEGINPRTRRYPLWALLGSRELMIEARDRYADAGLPMVEMFWLLRELASLACAVMGSDVPRAKVYHAHTTGYAALLGAVGARQNGGHFALTEHNLYARDTINVLLDRSMATTVTARDWRDHDGATREKAWMAWWIEMARFCYPSAEALTYLYPRALGEASDLGAPIERSTIIPNGMVVRDFAEVAATRSAVTQEITGGNPDRVWRLVYIARVVPIKGLADFITTLAQLIKRGITNIHLDVLGPTDHTPDYYMLCRERARTLGVENYLTFRGSVDVRAMLGEFDVLVLPSYNEGQPMVVLEAMAAGIPTVGTSVGGMAQLISDTLITPGGREWGPCGLLVRPVSPEHTEGMADALQTLMRDREMYARMAANARGRVEGFFQLEDAMGAYNRLYKQVGELPGVEMEESLTAAAERATVEPSPDVRAPGTSRVNHWAQR